MRDQRAADETRPNAALEEATGADVPAAPAFQLGGQALVEGVMMRSPRFVGAAVRHADGRIVTRVEPFESYLKKRPVLALPLLRGTFALFEMLTLGMRYLNWSSQIALEGDEMAAGDAESTSESTSESTFSSAGVAPAEAAAATVETADTPREQKLPMWLFLLTVAGSFSLGIALFVALPYFAASWLPGPWQENAVAFTLVEGVIKLAIFVAYIWLIGLKPDIGRLFEYHGAEHKVVYAAENRLPITPASARPFPTPHPRCGTGFALLTVVVSIVCFVFPSLWTDSKLMSLLWRLALLPVVAGISYEILKLTTHPKLGWLAVLVMTPGLWLQRLTTREPDDDQLEVSCTAMRAVLDAERGGVVVPKPGVI